ncbi:MAG: response regulator [Chloroflexi bacterium]|nr:response regulator [Chloroflexota bacterium]
MATIVPTAAPRRILVVDDDAIIRSVVAEVLADEGYSTLQASNGGEALAALATWPADLIVLDLMMPVMDGWAFLAAKHHNADLAAIPVIVLSAARTGLERMQHLAPAAVLSKPFDIADLVDTVQAVVPLPS